MARYRIEFSRDWLRGRWGYIDRIFFKLGGKETEPSRTEDAWLVEYKGKPRALGAYLTDVLELKEKVDAAGAAATSDGGGEAEVVAALEALGYSSREGRDAARSAVAALPPEASLEDRVKEALQALRQ